MLATAAALGEASVLARARAYWEAFVASPATAPIPVDVAALVLCSVVRAGGAAEYAQVSDLYYSASGDAAARPRYLSAPCPPPKSSSDSDAGR